MSNAQLQAEVRALRERIAVEKVAKAQRDAAETDEYRATQLTQERDRLKAELASVLGVEVASVQAAPPDVQAAPPEVEAAPQQSKQGKPTEPKNDPAAPGVPT